MRCCAVSAWRTPAPHVASAVSQLCIAPTGVHWDNVLLGIRRVWGNPLNGMTITYVRSTVYNTTNSHFKVVYTAGSLKKLDCASQSAGRSLQTEHAALHAHHASSGS
eukprot:scpid72888/ scgid10260/ 